MESIKIGVGACTRERPYMFKVLLKELAKQKIPNGAEVTFSGYLIGRNDFNDRNLSLVYRNGQPELAPAHDLLGFFCSHDKLDMTIGGVRHPGKVRIQDWRRAVGKTQFSILYEQLVRLSGECPEKSQELSREFESEGIWSNEIATICSGIDQRTRMVRQQLSKDLKRF